MEQSVFNELYRTFSKKLSELMLDDSLIQDLERVYLPLANMITVGISHQDQMQIIGINGAQGAGKTSFCNLMKLVLEVGYGMKVLSISIDDLYLSLADRQKLAEDIHPLLITRGVPGTHNVQQGIDLFDTLANATPNQQTLIPRFDKSTDDCFPREKWDVYTGRPDVVLFDGWMIGTVAQPLADLVDPINDLEKSEDPDGIWRTFVNLQLATSYKRLFDRLNLLVMLKVPSFDKVLEWRTLQEKKLAIKMAESGQSLEKTHVMTDEAAMKRFVAHYERLTRWTLKDLPSRVDMLFAVNEDHRICL